MKEIRREHHIDPEDAYDLVTSEYPTYKLDGLITIDRTEVDQSYLANSAILFSRRNMEEAGFAAMTGILRADKNIKILSYVPANLNTDPVQAVYMPDNARSFYYVRLIPQKGDRPVLAQVQKREMELVEGKPTLPIYRSDHAPLGKRVSVDTKFAKDILADTLLAIAPDMPSIFFDMYLRLLGRKNDELIFNALTILKSYSDIVGNETSIIKDMIKAFAGLEHHLVTPHAKIGEMKMVQGERLIVPTSPMREAGVTTLNPTSVLISNCEGQINIPRSYTVETLTRDFEAFFSLVTMKDIQTGQSRLFRILYNIDIAPFTIQTIERDYIPIDQNSIDSRNLSRHAIWKEAKDLTKEERYNIATAFALNVWPAMISRLASDGTQDNDLLRKSNKGRPAWVLQKDAVKGASIPPEDVFTMWCQSIRNEIEKE